MALVINLPDEVLQRLESVASVRGMTTTELAVEMLSTATLDEDRFTQILDRVVSDHREIIDRLANT